MENTWQLVSGKIEADETAPQAALRELYEEAALRPTEFYQLDVINSFYIAKFDTIVHAPMFCAIVDPDATVKINDEHIAYRWISTDEMESHLMWPSERTAAEELRRAILGDSPAKPYLRIPI